MKTTMSNNSVCRDKMPAFWEQMPTRRSRAAVTMHYMCTDLTHTLESHSFILNAGNKSILITSEPFKQALEETHPHTHAHALL